MSPGNHFTLLVGGALAVALVCAGCKPADKPVDPKPAPTKAPGTTAVTDDGSPKVASTGHDHSGWWCAEHGIPEDECALCSSKVAAEFKRKGDWCAKHDRPDSQCFICHPEREEFYAAKYEAKYGTRPPPREPEPEEDKGEEN